MKFGNPQKVRESLWIQNSPQLLSNAARDVKYAFRTLSRAPGFTMIAVATLALGVGANTAIFSVINATLLRPLPYKHSDRIVMVWGTNPGGFGWRGKSGFSAPSFLDYRERNRVFDRMATFNGADFTLVGSGSSFFGFTFG